MYNVDTGKVYEITSEGISNGSNCYDGGLAVDDISASTYNIHTKQLQWLKYFGIQCYSLFYLPSHWTNGHAQSKSSKQVPEGSKQNLWYLKKQKVANPQNSSQISKQPWHGPMPAYQSIHPCESTPIVEQ